MSLPWRFPLAGPNDLLSTCLGLDGPVGPQFDQRVLAEFGGLESDAQIRW
jgi:hypothetical protein